MIEAEDDFWEASQASNPAAHVAGLTDSDLARLHGYAESILKRNDARTGFPATVKWCCVIEASNRFFKQLKTP
jgi:hypothetical protein